MSAPVTLVGCQPRAPACRWGGQSAPRSLRDRPHPHLHLAGEERRSLGRPPGSAWKGGQASWMPGSVQRRREAGLLEAGGETRLLASREKPQPMVGIRQPPLLWGNQLSSKEPGDVGDSPHWPRGTVAGPRLAGGHQAGCLRMPWARPPSVGPGGVCGWLPPLRPPRKGPPCPRLAHE